MPRSIRRPRRRPAWPGPRRRAPGSVQSTRLPTGRSDQLALAHSVYASSRVNIYDARHVYCQPARERSPSVRVTREQAAAHRQKILDVAGTLFRQHGFDGIGVADIMKRAGLTHGGFYGHFASKDDLAAEITSRVLGREGWMQRLAGPAKPSLGDVVRRYLSPRHRDDAGRGCLFAAL